MISKEIQRAAELAAAGRAAEAIALTQAEIRRDPASVEARCVAATASLTNGPVSAAGAPLRQACALAPSYAPVHYYLSRYRPERGDMAGMFASITRCRHLLPPGSKMAVNLEEFATSWSWLDNATGLEARVGKSSPSPDGESWIFVWRDVGEFLQHFDRANVGKRHTLLLPPSGASPGLDPTDALFEACRRFDPGIVVFLPGTARHRNPRVAAFRALRARGVPTVLVVPDLRKAYWQGVVKSIADAFDLVVSLDGCSLASLPLLHGLGERFFRGWSPISPVDIPAYVDRPIAANLVGSLWGDRIAGVDALRRAGIEVVTRPPTPPERQDAEVASHKTLTTEAYLDSLRRSRLTINFSASSTGDGDQLKGRVFEAAACGSLLLESANDMTRDYFEEGREFVYFDGIPDLVRKARYYLDHPDLAAEIAGAATKRFLERYTATHFWRAVLDRARRNNRGAGREAGVTNAEPS